MARIGVVVYPGSNCDDDCLRAVDAVGSEGLRIWHKETSLPKVDGILLPGGFSYGDYLRPGAIARFSPISESLVAYAHRGGPLVGICNGFQVLCELGLLPGALRRNGTLLFRCADQWLRTESEAGLLAGCPTTFMAPIAHHDGAYFADGETLRRLRGEDRVAFRYCHADGEVAPDANPNGSLDNIAGVRSSDGRILGMMPHPERNAEGILGDGSGRPVLEAWVRAMEGWV
jgi:phosphoribosylformylglycinamidine synthase